MPVQPAINHSLKPRNLDGPSHTLNGRAPQPDFHSVALNFKGWPRSVRGYSGLHL